MPMIDPDVRTAPDPDVHAGLDLAIGHVESPQADPGVWNPITCQSVYCY